MVIIARTLSSPPSTCPTSANDSIASTRRTHRCDVARNDGVTDARKTDALSAIAPDDDLAREDGAIVARPTVSGLGLAITQWIVEEHGGRLRIQSERDHGAVVDI